MEHSLTTGSVWKTVVRFSLPYLLSYFLQTLYGMADLFIIGQFNGTASTTAVSIGSQVMHMLTVMIVGLAMGSTVLIGQAVGGGNHRKAAEVIGNTVTLFLALAVALTAVLLALAGPIVSIMSTPAEAVSETRAYLTVCFLGIPFITAYNIISSIFRGMGDSKSPMYFVAVACVANIALDYLFIGGFGLGAAGAALGTTLAQTVSVIVSLVVILRRRLGPALTKGDFRPKSKTMQSLLRIGIPVACQDGFIQVSFILITIFANLRGLNDAAAVGIVEKIISLLFLVPSSMLQSVSALSAQNIGAGKPERARLTLRYACTIAVCWGVGAALIMQVAAGNVIGLFSQDAVVVEMGSQYIHSYVWDCALAGIHFCFSGYFCACGHSGLSFLHNFLSIVLARVPLAYFASTHFPDSLFPMGLASTTGSALSVVVCVVAWFWLKKREAEPKAVG